MAAGGIIWSIDSLTPDEEEHNKGILARYASIVVDKPNEVRTDTDAKQNEIQAQSTLPLEDQ
jgi:hypothetical protein